MNKRFYLFIFIFSFCGKLAIAQIICITCYDQNDSISNGVNNLVLNGSFENSTCTPAPGWIGAITSICPNSIGYACDINNWTCTGGGDSTYTCLYDGTWSVIPEGTKAIYFGNFYCKACSALQNDTSCFEDRNCIVTHIPSGYPENTIGFGGNTGVSLSQTINGLIPGSIYVLEFWAGGENIGNEKGLFAVDLGFGNTFMRDRATATGFGTRFIIQFAATSSSHTIKFTNWGHICSQCTELVLDDVRLYTQAELNPTVSHCVEGIQSPGFQNDEYLFPNPVTNELNIRTNTSLPSKIILYDITSKKILQQSFINSASINTAGLPRGIYIYELSDEVGVIKKGKVIL